MQGMIPGRACYSIGDYHLRSKTGNRENMPLRPTLISRKTGAAAAVVILICVAVMAAYTPSLQGSFILDDFRNIVDNPGIRIAKIDLHSLASAAKPPPGLSQRRPLSFISFALNYFFGGLDPAGYRLTNLAILLLSIPLAAAVSFLLARTWLPPYQSALMALSAAVLWALNPLLTNGVAYIVQRMTSLNALFCLASLACFLMGFQTARRSWYIGSAAAWLLALGVKETALPVVLVAFLYLWMALPADKQASRWTGWGLVTFIVVSQAGIIALFHENFAYFNFDIPQRLLTEGRVVLRYLTLFLLPLPSRMSLDYEFPLSQALFTPPMTAVAIVLHLLLISGSLAARRRRPLASFCLLSFYLLNSLESTVAPLEIIFEHRTYLPSLFLALGIIDLLSWILESLSVRRAGELVLALSILFGMWWGTLTHQRNQVWSNPVTFWEDIVAKSPSNHRAHNNLGKFYLEKGELTKALEHLEKSYQLEPDNMDPLLNAGVVYHEMKNFTMAHRKYSEVIARDPNNVKALYNMGNLNLDTGRYKEAIQYFGRALEINPRQRHVNHNMALAYYRIRNPDAAMMHLERELKVNPGFSESISFMKVIRARKN